MHRATRRPLDLRAVLIVVALSVIWGVQQVAMKAVAADVAPTMQLAVRFSGPQSSSVYGYSCARAGLPSPTHHAQRPADWHHVCARIHIRRRGTCAHYRAHTIVFLYAAPIFTALGLQFLPEERLRRCSGPGLPSRSWASSSHSLAGQAVRLVRWLAVICLALLGGAELGADQRGSAARPGRHAATERRSSIR